MFFITPKILFIFALLTITKYSDANDSLCLNRCDRLLTRTLAQIDYTPRKIEKLFKSFQRIKNLGDICWKFYDFNDCQMQCDRRPKRDLTTFEELSKMVLKRCKFVNEVSSQNIKCIHKYHSFMEVRCSSYLAEAVKLKQKVRGKKDPRTQETCRFLHYHHTCLANTVFFYCPSAKKHFNKFTLRDYFLSFIVPDNDEAFPDDFLDYCQVFDFAKQAKDVYDTTSSLKQEDFVDEVTKSAETVTDAPVVKLLDSDDSRSSNRPVKKLFSSTESLEDTPPNFFFSSARMETTTYSAPTNRDTVEKQLKDSPHSGEATAYTTSRFWNVEPVNIEFVSHPMTDKSSSPAPEDDENFTINPNDLVSTIFRIPNIFPTDVTHPDSVTEANLDVGKEVVLDDGLQSDGNNSVEWKPKTLITVTKVGKPASTESTESRNIDDFQVVNILNDGSKETYLTVSANNETTILKNSTSSEELSNVSAEQTFNSTDLTAAAVNETTPKHTDLNEKKPQLIPNITSTIASKKPAITASPTKLVVDESNNVSTTTLSEAEEPKPLLHGTKIHIKRIRHYSEPGEGLKGDTIKKGDDKTIYFSHAQAKATIQYQTTYATSTPDLSAPKIVTPRGDLLPELSESDPDPQDINWETLQSIKWFIIGYSLLFAVTLGVVVYLVLSLILKQCQKRRLKTTDYTY